MELLLQLAEEKNKEKASSKAQKFEDDVREFKQLANKMYQDKYAEQQRAVVEQESKKAHQADEYLLSLGRPAIADTGLSLPNLPKIEEIIVPEPEPRHPKEV